MTAENSHLAQARTPTLEGGHLKLLTFNMQVGIQTSAYHHYLTRSWQHLLPHPHRARRLDMVSSVLSRFDIVGLQEVDGGSFRSGNINQIDYLASRADMPYRFQQLNRNLGRFAQHSNGLLCRLPAARVENHRLPGPPGRGAIHARFGIGDDALHVFVAHLALGAKTQARQLDYLSELISPLRHVVLMGDLNCTVEQMRKHPRFFESIDLQPLEALLSYPAWQPKRALDHILISSTLTVRQYSVLDQLFSDHLPVAAEIELPEACAVALDEASDIWIPPPKTVLV